MNASRKEISNKICKYVTDIAPILLKEDDFREDLPLLKNGLGLDSIAAVELFFTLEDVFGMPFDPELFNNTPLTIGKLIDYVINNTKT